MKDWLRETTVLSLAGFTDWRVIRYYDTARYSAEGFVSLMNTWSDHAGLSDDFFRSMAAVIDDAGERSSYLFGRHCASAGVSRGVTT